MTRLARCLCGEFVVTCEGEPVLHAQCSCRSCQKTTGAPSAFWLYYAREQVADNGHGVSYQRDAILADGPTIHRCKSCGSPLSVSVGWTKEVLGVDIQGIPYGCFEERDFSAPQMAVWNKYLPSWLESSAPAACTLEEQPNSLEAFKQTLIDFGLVD